MRHIPHAHRIRQRFYKSVATYAEHAVVQKRMAERLCALIHGATKQRHWSCALDLGCGTGFLTDAFEQRFHADRIWAYDVVDAFAACFSDRAACEFVAADLNHFSEYPEADIVLSGATLQWITDVPALFQRLHQRTATGALLAFSSFTPDNFHEITTVSERGLIYPSCDTVYGWLEKTGWQIRATEQERLVSVFPDAHAVLRHLQRTGVTATGDARGWTKGKLRKFVEQYERFKLPDGQGYPLTYTPFYVVATRES